MLTVINDLVVTAEELTWKRNMILKKLYELEKLAEELSDSDPSVAEFKKNVKIKISECLSILEDIDSEEEHESADSALSPHTNHVVL